MKKKVIDVIIDILLIATAFAITDLLMWKVFQSESVWLELGTYVAFYAALFGTKRGVIYLWQNRHRTI